MTGELTVFWAVFTAGMGLLLGSFINAWVWRVETDRSIAKGRSMCPHCHHELAWYDLVPVLSFLALGGKCRSCHKKISWRYPTIELITSGLFLVLYLAFTPTSLLTSIQLVVLLAITVLLVASASYDQKHSLLPDVFTLPAIALSVVYMLLVDISNPANIIAKLVATIVFCLFFFALWYLSGGGAMGDGDIRLAAIMGLILTPWQLTVAAVAGFNSGAIVAIILLMTHKKKRTDHIAFGPFLILGMYFGLLFADKLALF